ncbi:MAG: hypothetical protein HZC54_01720 [Verrucomicrobia bacterium]|nr:hypothetical protein [Verrucomicrobiota bacterium]
MPLLTSYVGYLYDEWGLKLQPDRGYHDNLADTMRQGGFDYQVLHVSLGLPNGVVNWHRARAVASQLMAKNPNARFFLRTYFIMNRKTFASRHPGEMTQFEDGTEAHWTESGAKRDRYSFASTEWERQGAKALQKMLTELAKEPFAERVFGVCVTFGVTGEGGWWTEFDSYHHGIDYSPAMRGFFREFARTRYTNDAARLRRAWGDSAATFDTIQPPTLQERGIDGASSCNESKWQVPGSFGHFRNPQAAGTQKSIDFHSAMCAVMHERLGYFCETVKRATKGKLIAGGLHSPPFAATGFQSAGPSGFGTSLQSAYIDFMSTPWHYESRNLGETLAFRGPADSMRLRNKCFWIECDTRTSAVKDRRVDSARTERTYGAPLDAEGDVNVLRRDFARLATASEYGYWFEIAFPWFTKDEHHKTIKEIGRLSRLAMKLDRRRNAEIAVIFDWDSIYHASEHVNFVALCRQMLQEFAYIGADYDVYMMEDIGREEVDRHKLFIFPNAFCLNNAKREKVRRHLQRDGKVLLWSYGAGLINPDAETKLAIEHASSLTGMRLGCIEKRLSPLMTIVNNPPSARFPVGFQFGAQPRPVITGPGYATPEKPFIPKSIQVFPQFFVEDSGASVIATYNDTDKIGCALKRLPRWTSVYSGTHLMSSRLLREVARLAGVHIYCDEDEIVWHNRNLLALHVHSPHKKTIALPQKCDVYDLFADRLIGRQTDRFEVDPPCGKTLLYFTGDYKRLQSITATLQKFPLP